MTPIGAFALGDAFGLLAGLINDLSKLVADLL